MTGSGTGAGADPADWSCPTPVGRRRHVVMGHGGGGRLTAELVAEVFQPAFANPVLDRLADAATVAVPEGTIAITTDAFVVQPLFFPGGDIGTLAVHGTVNDLACAGAVPRYLTAAFVIEEGMALDDLARIAASMAAAALDAGVTIVAGDTKVVDRGRGDGVHITTAGVGVVRPGVEVGPDLARPGDAVLVSGPIGQHGVAVMSVREGLEFGTPVVSDSAPVHRLVAGLVDAAVGVHVLRDPTRGGVAAALNEIAVASGVGVMLDETSVPVAPEVRSACSLLGLDPLQVANEGRLLAIVTPEHTDRALESMRECAEGRQATVIGRIVADHPGMVVGRTAIGGTRVIDLPLGELLPRIC
jgi:hydrogenase expression/formation protein HypE